MSRDQYEILETIGTGSFGTVKRIRRKGDDKVLVWKEINFGKMSEREKGQLVAEVNIIRELRNPFIVKYHDRIVEKSSTMLYIIMEYCPAGDLGKMISKCRREKSYIDEAFIWKVFAQCLLALKDCHRRTDESGAPKPVLHRDLKPANILLDSSQNVKIADFGLAKELQSIGQLAQTNVGTPLYMAPEIINEKHYDEKSDIWALACLLYEMAALKSPFDALNAMQLAIKVNAGKFSRIPSRYSDQLQDAIKMMLVVDPKRRPRVEQLESLPGLQSSLLRARAMLVDFHAQHAQASKLREMASKESSLYSKEQELLKREQQLLEKERQVTALAQEVQEAQKKMTAQQQQLALKQASQHHAQQSLHHLQQQQQHQHHHHHHSHEVPQPQLLRQRSGSISECDDVMMMVSDHAPSAPALVCAGEADRRKAIAPPSQALVTSHAVASGSSASHATSASSSSISPQNLSPTSAGFEIFVDPEVFAHSTSNNSSRLFKPVPALGCKAPGAEPAVGMKRAKELLANRPLSVALGSGKTTTGFVILSDAMDKGQCARLQAEKRFRTGCEAAKENLVALPPPQPASSSSSFAPPPPPSVVSVPSTVRTVLRERPPIVAATSNTSHMITDENSPMKKPRTTAPSSHSNAGMPPSSMFSVDLKTIKVNAAQWAGVQNNCTKTSMPSRNGAIASADAVRMKQQQFAIKNPHAQALQRI